MTTTKAALVGALSGVLATLLVAGALLAFWPRAAFATNHEPPVTHEQMHQMMDAMHGPGTSQRMHEAMGPDAEKHMDQCAAAMGSMNMGSMMGSGMMGGSGGMMGGGGMLGSGMMGGSGGMMGGGGAGGMMGMGGAMDGMLRQIQSMMGGMQGLAGMMGR